MSDQLVKELLEIIQGSKNFVLDQAPDVAKQIVTFGRVIEPIELLCVIAALIGVIVLLRYTDTQIKTRKWDDVAWVPVGFASAIAGVMAIAGFFCALEGSVKCWFAPKLYLLDYLAHLTHSK